MDREKTGEFTKPFYKGEIVTKKGQITVFIIIGLIILFVIGTVLYVTRTRVTKEIEAARPRVAEIPQQIQPLRDFAEQCIKRLATDGLRRIGDSGGYIETTHLAANPFTPTEGDAVQFSPAAGPTVAYWWYLKSKNTCEQNCVFETKRPGLYRTQGGINIESQLDAYITNNLRTCLGNFEDYRKTGCTVQERGEPKVTANVAAEDVFFVGKYPLRAVCQDQTFDIEDYYVTIDLNLKEIYNLATELTNFESGHRILEQATKTIIGTFSEIDSSKLPPPRAFEVGPPAHGTYWIKFEVLKRIKTLLSSYIPIIQVSSVRNYHYIAAPPGTRDPALFELTYNRNFFVPLNTTHPTLEARFSYLDWWEPYFDLNCNGQICQPDSASNFLFIPLTMNRYEFAYDLSYPVLVEIRNPFAFNKEGYSFKFFLEQNMRNSDALGVEAPPLTAAEGKGIPSIFCDEAQRTSGEVRLHVKDGKTLTGMNGASISYICGENNCNLGKTAKGDFKSKFPRCLGGALRVTQPGYASHSEPLDTFREEPIDINVLMEPVRILNATIKNYALTKAGKREPWEFREGAPLRPPATQSAVIQLVRNSTPYEEPYSTVVELTGDKPGELTLIPGTYMITINSFLKENITIPKDQRCVRIKKLFGSKRKCFFVPEKPVYFNETAPFPYGGAEYEYTFTTSMLRGARNIEFRQFILAIDRVSEANRIVEDLNEINKITLYGRVNEERLYPVIT